MAARRIVEDAIEVGGDQQSLFSVEATRLTDLNAFGLLQIRPPVTVALRRQLRTAFGAAALKHEPAGLGCHPGTETMGSGALQSAGLVGAFHEPRILLLMRPWRPVKRKGGKGTRAPLTCQ